MTSDGAHLEQVIAGHAGLAGHTGGDDHDVSALERLTQLGIALIALRTTTRRVRHGRLGRTDPGTATTGSRTLTWALVLTWLMSAATPTVPAISKQDSWVTAGFICVSIERNIVSNHLAGRLETGKWALA